MTWQLHHQVLLSCGTSNGCHPTYVIKNFKTLFIVPHFALGFQIPQIYLDWVQRTNCLFIQSRARSLSLSLSQSRSLHRRPPLICAHSDISWFRLSSLIGCSNIASSPFEPMCYRSACQNLSCRQDVIARFGYLKLTTVLCHQRAHGAVQNTGKWVMVAIVPQCHYPTKYHVLLCYQIFLYNNNNNNA